MAEDDRTTILFDTLKALEKLKASGISDNQAHAMVETLHEAGDTAQLATRGDLMDMGIGFKHDIEGLRADIKLDLVGLERRMDGFEHKLISQENRLTIRLGVMMAAMISAATAVTHYLH